MAFLSCVSAITQTIKCAHERSVHLFIDSLQHSDLQSIGFQCSDMGSFSQGLCLSCKKGRCNTLGYDIRKDRSGKSKRLFLITRAQSPFKGECLTSGTLLGYSAKRRKSGRKSCRHAQTCKDQSTLCSERSQSLTALSYQQCPCPLTAYFRDSVQFSR